MKADYLNLSLRTKIPEIVENRQQEQACPKTLNIAIKEVSGTREESGGRQGLEGGSNREAGNFQL